MTFSLFLVYWIIVGSIFASFSFIRNMKIRKARFGCLFTIFSMISAVGATYTGYLAGRENINECVERGLGWSESMVSFLGCSMFAISLMAIAWFFALFGFGLLSLLISRSWNQSWIDHELEDNEVVEFSYRNS